MRYILFIFLAVVSIGAKAQVQNIAFNKEMHDFGKLKQNVPATYTFTFTNKEKKPVLVTVATASCGCTTPVWTTTPVKPGKTGTIKVGYDAKNAGPFEKTITVTFQGNFVKEIKIKGNVAAK